MRASHVEKDGLNMASELSRRNFITGGVAVAAGAATVAAKAALAGEAVDPTQPWVPAWDEECDIVVAGYGAAGVTAAISACEQGMKTIVLEKSPIEDGGNFGCSTSNLHDTFRCDLDEIKTKAKRMSFYCVPNEDAINHLCDVMVQDMYPWLTDELGFSFFEGTREGTARHATDSAIMFYRTPEGHPGAGYEFFAALSQVAKDKGAEVRLGSPITGLVQSPLTREVLGVEYSDDGGATTKTIKAKHGVIMCVGGFENSKIKQAWYNHAGIFQQCWGTPYNTGDGIDICSAAGAAMWHLEGCEWSACAYRLPSEEVGCAVSMPEKGYDPYTTTYFWVNKYGSRFMNEQTTMNHNIGKTPLTDWTHNKGKYPNADEYPNLPFWMVFDQNMYDKVQLYQGTGYWGLLDTYCAVQGLQPTEDWNDYALDKGWIVKADTIEERLHAGTLGGGPVLRHRDVLLLDQHAGWPLARRLQPHARRSGQRHPSSVQLRRVRLHQRLRLPHRQHLRGSDDRSYRCPRLRRPGSPGLSRRLRNLTRRVPRSLTYIQYASAPRALRVRTRF